MRFETLCQSILEMVCNVPSLLILILWIITCILGGRTLMVGSDSEDFRPLAIALVVFFALFLLAVLNGLWRWYAHVQSRRAGRRSDEESGGNRRWYCWRQVSRALHGGSREGDVELDVHHPARAITSLRPAHIPQRLRSTHGSLPTSQHLHHLTHTLPNIDGPTIPPPSLMQRGLPLTLANLEQHSHQIEVVDFQSITNALPASPDFNSHDTSLFTTNGATQSRGLIHVLDTTENPLTFSDLSSIMHHADRASDLHGHLMSRDAHYRDANSHRSVSLTNAMPFHEAAYGAMPRYAAHTTPRENKPTLVPTHANLARASYGNAPFPPRPVTRGKGSEYYSSRDSTRSSVSAMGGAYEEIHISYSPPISPHPTLSHSRRNSINPSSTQNTYPVNLTGPRSLEGLEMRSLPRRDSTNSIRSLGRTVKSTSTSLLYDLTHGSDTRTDRSGRNARKPSAPAALTAPSYDLPKGSFESTAPLVPSYPAPRLSDERTLSRDSFESVDLFHGDAKSVRLSKAVHAGVGPYLGDVEAFAATQESITIGLERTVGRELAQAIEGGENDMMEWALGGGNRGPRLTGRRVEVVDGEGNVVQGRFLLGGNRF